MTQFLAQSLRLLFLAAAILISPVNADPIPVLHLQGSAHGFLSVKNLQGARIAIGDVIQSVHGDRVTLRVTLRFHDGSLDDEATVFTQRRTFRLITDHHVQRGPSFPKPIDVFIDALSGQITSRDQDGKIKEDHLDLPDDVANGLAGKHREALITVYSPQVLDTATRMHARLPTEVSLDALISAGQLGLVAAIDDFDSTNGELEPEVPYRIRGAILDFLRALDWVAPKRDLWVPP